MNPNKKIIKIQPNIQPNRLELGRARALAARLYPPVKISIKPSGINPLEHKVIKHLNPANKKRVFIVGGGASLIGFDFNSLVNEDVIAVNKAIEFVHHAKYFIDRKSVG